jgi:2-polyprenylphenol 6-hydroxylase
MTIKTDILVVGGGLVGASLALALSETRWKVALAEARTDGRSATGDAAVGAMPSGVTGDTWDARIYAIAPASRSFLEGLGVWQRLDAKRVAPIQAMRVRGDSRSKLEFSAHDSGVAALAWIVESGALMRALWASMERQPRLDILCPAAPQALAVGSDGARLQLADGRGIEARLVIGADGARSFVRASAGIASTETPYGQCGVVANFSCARAHRSVAWQWFREDGVLAWLPLPGERMSMVWSTPQAHAEELLSLPDAEFCARVADAGEHALGELRLITRPTAFPLVALKSAAIVAPRIALVGDAAHVVHPLAGQGVNLGFGDAQALCAVLSDALEARSGDARDGVVDPGARLLLRRYERARAEDILSMQWATHGLARLFGSRAPGATLLRNWGLNLVNRLPMVKNALVSHAVAESH